jgi:hypothetical protein
VNPLPASTATAMGKRPGAGVVTSLARVLPREMSSVMGAGCRAH